MVCCNIRNQKGAKIIVSNYYDLLRNKEIEDNLIELLNEIDIKREEVLIVKKKQSKRRRQKQEQLKLV